ncbi:MAG TPA: hypothetical protein ENI72_01700 [Rhodospirillales bacterium]|nr:hypothetical protein [Rhodospirillales bacterium]
MRWTIFGLATMLVTVIAVMAFFINADNGEVVQKQRYAKGLAVSAVASTPRAAPSPDFRGSARSRPDPKDRFEPGEVIVLNPPKRFEAKIEKLRFTVLEKVSLPGLSSALYRLGTPPGKPVPVALKLLSSQFSGLVADANHYFELQAGEEASLSRLKVTARMAAGWDKVSGSCGMGVKIGMVDASVDVTHPAFSGRNLRFISFNRRDRKPGSAKHGTAIAAMLIGNKKWGGLLPGAELLAANMFEVNAAGRTVGSALGLAKALNWMVMSRVHAINLSIAGADNKVMRRIFSKVTAKGITLVAAVGNKGWSDKRAYPAGYNGVLTVTAVGDGNRIYRRANMGNYIDFAAPGVKIWTAVPGGGALQSGTSMATPFVTALLALDIAFKRSPSPAKVLVRQAVDLGVRGKDPIFGWGRVKELPQCG